MNRLAELTLLLSLLVACSSDPVGTGVKAIESVDLSTTIPPPDPDLIDDPQIVSVDGKDVVVAWLGNSCAVDNDGMPERVEVDYQQSEVTVLFTSPTCSQSDDFAMTFGVRVTLTTDPGDRDVVARYAG